MEESVDLHKRRSVSIPHSINNLNDKRKQIQETGAHLLWKRTSEECLKYDIIITFTPKGFHIIDSLYQIITERLPNLIVDIKPHAYNKEQAFYITAEDDYLAEGATILGFKNESLKSLQKQRIIMHYLNSLRWNGIENNHLKLNEYKKLQIREGEAIIARLLSLKLIDQMLPLHHEFDLSQLRKGWVSTVLKAQPLDKICQYFGMRIAIYFAFLGYYTSALIFPTIFGILITVFSHKYYIAELSTILFSIFNVFWASLFLLKWKRYCDNLVNRWSSMHLGTGVKFVRPLFRGKLIQKDTKGQNVELMYPKWKRQLFKYFITFPIIGFSLICVFGIVFTLFEFQTWWDEILIKEHDYPKWTSFLPKIILAILIQIFNAIYYQIAVWLNNKENYQYEEKHENNLIAKLVLFEIGNSFLSLFYIAFYIGDINRLREVSKVIAIISNTATVLKFYKSFINLCLNVLKHLYLQSQHLAIILIIRQLIGNFKESLWPFIVESYKLSPKLQNIKQISQGEFESSMYRYESTFDDYLEMINQFGYVILFSPTFPLAALCSIINNIIEIRSDAFKLCVVYQRPFAGDLVKDIGEWQNVMNIMVYLGIIVNCALIAKSTEISKIIPFKSDVQTVLFSVVLEHILFAIRWFSPFMS